MSEGAGGSDGAPEGQGRSGDAAGRCNCCRSIRIVAVAMIVVAVALIAIAISDMPASITSEPDCERSFTVGDLTVSGGVYRDDVEVRYIDGEATLIYVGLGEQVYWLYEDCSQPMFQADGDEYECQGYHQVIGDTLSFSEPGAYGIRLTVDGEYTDGKIELDGQIHDDFSWSRDIAGTSMTYSIGYTYSFDEYYRYADSETPRHMVGELSDSRFVVVDDAILRLSAELERAYEAVHGERAGGSQDYADYLLSFVQCYISYPVVIAWNGSAFVEDPNGYADLFLYGSEEYWAYPMETIYFRCGDCEDSAFLMSALLSAAGYTSSLLTFADHMVAAVALDHYTPADWFQGQMTWQTVTLTGHHFYICESTFEKYTPLGYSIHEVGLDSEMPVRYVVVPPYSERTSG